MGGFIFCTNNFDISMGLKYFNKHGFETSFEYANNVYKIIVFNKLLSDIKEYNYYHDKVYDDFIISSGTLFYNNIFGAEALKRILLDFKDKKLVFTGIENKILGHYFLLISINNKIYFINDRGSIYKTYIHKNNGLILSSSFLPIVDMIDKKSLDKNEMYEYVFTSAICGNKTILKEIGLIGGNEIGIFSNKDVIFKTKPAFNTIIKHGNIDNTVESFYTLLNEYMVPVKKYFNGSIASELTGGLDTRLMACILKHNNIDHVYSHMELGSSDYKVATNIAQNENRKIIVAKTSKSKNNNNLKSYKKYLLKNACLFDYMNFLVGFNKEDYETFYEIGKNCDLVVGGQAGEIFSAYDWLENVKVKSLDISKNTINFTRTHKNIFSNKREYNSFINNYNSKLSILLNIKEGSLTDYEKNMFRPLVLSRTGDSTYVSYANKHMFFLSPFTDAQISFNTAYIPYRHKTNRKVTLKLIKRFDKGLASYPYCSHVINKGHSLNIRELKGKKTLRDKLKLFIPDNLFNYLSYKLSKYELMPEYLKNDFIVDLFENKPLNIERYINTKYSRNVGILNRIYTMELLIRKYNITI